MQPYRIGIGGIAIESSTFSPWPSTADDFSILRGEEMQVRYPFMPGWSFHGRSDITWLPCLQAKAIPGGPVVGQDYAAMKHELLERIRAALPLDGFYLDIHGAMNVLGMDDAEADLADAIRELVGADCLISAGMDLHGNVSARLVELVDIFTAYRLAPHDDVLQTREKACALLLDCLDRHIRPLRAWVRIPVILPGERTSTLVEPGKSVYASLEESDPTPGVLDASLWVGYVWADEPRSSASVVVTGTDPASARREAQKIARRYWGARKDFAFVAPAGSADWCIEQAIAWPGNGVVISDSGDNPTAGGVGDVPYFIGRLLAHPALASGQITAIYASIPDAAAVRACFAAGIGNDVAVSLGGKLDRVHGQPLAVRGSVAAVLPDDPVGGRIAVLRVGGVHVIVTSRRKPYHFIADFTGLGLDPSAHKITAVKIGYLEPELRQIARHALLALTPGAVNQDIPALNYQRVVRPIYPLDPEFESPDLTARLFGASSL
ncbi:MAG TPA: M81 family metallopeptidase [Roseiflexaceae bacterium]|nr:M81 family metallopeptidase [Roseiflexaceae bacterium]